MTRDPQMLMSIQIACIGIVIVIGFFYIWRSLSRIENKIDGLACQYVNNGCIKAISNNMAPSCPIDKGQQVSSNNIVDDGTEHALSSDEEDEDDISIMRACLGDIPIETLMDNQRASFMIFNTLPDDTDDTIDKKQGVVLKEIDDNKKSSEGLSVKVSDETVSVEETDTNDLSKTKLRKMNLDALKDVCQSRGLSTDGAKSALIDRIIASLPIS